MFSGLNRTPLFQPRLEFVESIAAKNTRISLYRKPSGDVEMFSMMTGTIS